ncbi:MAG: hypothetical protein K0R62_8378 [Nonomuraea muscovyensis]|nr:hypothetical protein [Nonomuraea muscovyensis]
MPGDQYLTRHCLAGVRLRLREPRCPQEPPVRVEGMGLALPGPREHPHREEVRERRLGRLWSRHEVMDHQPSVRLEDLGQPTQEFEAALFGEVVEDDRRPDAERRPEAERRPDADRTPDAERRPEADRGPEVDQTPDRRPEVDRRPEADQTPTRRPEADRRPDADRTPEADRTPDADRRPEADRTPNRRPKADRGPEATRRPKPTGRATPLDATTRSHRCGNLRCFPYG